MKDFRKVFNNNDDSDNYCACYNCPKATVDVCARFCLESVRHERALLLVATLFGSFRVLRKGVNSGLAYSIHTSLL
jgi:hypothetical protein